MRRTILDPRAWPWVLAGLAALVLLPGVGHHGDQVAADTQARDPSATDGGGCTSDGVAVNLDCPALPDTTAVGQWVDDTGKPLSPQPSSPQSDGGAYLDFDLWAWNSFIAMNWPALEPSENRDLRGFPDLSKTFAGASNDDLAVWETYKEKREVFLYDYIDDEPSTETPQPWNSAPRYGPSEAQVPCCPGQDCSTGGMERHFANSSKLFFDTLDETAEVASEARETREVLCEGWVDPSTDCDKPGANTCCGLHGGIVGPRVWMGDPHDGSNAKPVLYEVKVNYDFFQYVLANKYYLVQNARADARTGSIRLPARTSASAMPPPPGTQSFGKKHGPNPGTTGYRASECFPSTDPSQSATPCPAGSVHLKAAWVSLEGASAAERAKYHTADVLHYLSNDEVEGGICKEPATYGLVGLHIIQRIHHDEGIAGQGGTGAGPPRGGTFVFATWEHTGNDDAGFTYANYSPAPPQGQPSRPAPFPNIARADALALERVYPPLPSTERANSLVHRLLGCDGGGPVWCNYQLIGTQYVAAQLPSPEPKQLTALEPQPANVEAPVGSGQPYYLANLVVESNVGLQQFQGLPVTTDSTVIQVIPHYQPGDGGGVTSRFSTSAFQRSAQNLAFRTSSGGHSRAREFNMGGCMGCHGVAQLSGYSFSFVLLDNQYGAAPDTLSDFEIPPTPDPPVPPPPPPSGRR